MRPLSASTRTGGEDGWSKRMSMCLADASRARLANRLLGDRREVLLREVELEHARLQARDEQ